MSDLIYIRIIGFIAGILIIISFIPQLIIIILNKSSHNISLHTYILLFLSQVLWIIYGFFKNDLQIIISNCCILFINILIISFTLYYKYKNKENIISEYLE